MLKLQEIKSRELKNTNIFWGGPLDPPKGNTSPLFLFSLESLFVVGPSTEKSLKKALPTGNINREGGRINIIRKVISKLLM